MAVSPPPAPSSIDLSGLPPRVVEAAARVLALCREELRSEPRPEAPEEVELRVREATNEFARDVMGAVIENRDDGASRIERDGQSWFRVAVTPKTIMTSLGPVTYRRARYRSGASGASPVPVDESLGLVDDYLTRPAAELGLLMMGRCTAREAAAFFAKTGAMTPSVSTLQRLTLSMHECWESLGPETLGSIREAEGIPQDATTASVSLDGVMVPLRPGEDGRAKASWREAACGTVSFHDAEGKRLKTLYLGRMPESGKLTLKAQLASEVAHIRRARPEIGIVAIADGAADNWTFLETLSPETEVIDFWHACEHLQTASDHAVAPGWFEKYREILRHDPRGVAKVIRALRHLRDAAAAPDRAETERELAFFRKHRHRMRYHALKEEGIAIGSGVVEAANKTLVTQRMKRSGMRWRIVGGQAVLTFRALIKSGRFERAWKALISATDTPANDNISPRAAAMAIAALAVPVLRENMGRVGQSRQRCVMELCSMSTWTFKEPQYGQYGPLGQRWASIHLSAAPSVGNMAAISISEIPLRCAGRGARSGGGVDARLLRRRSRQPRQRGGAVGDPRRCRRGGDGSFYTRRRAHRRRPRKEEPPAQPAGARGGGLP